jgi:hypothetical protein
MASLKINVHFIRGSQGLHTQLQSIEDQIDKAKSTRDIRRLTKDLDQTSTALRAMKSKAQSVFGQTQQGYFGRLEDEIVSMYGRIEEAQVASKVSQIQDETEEIKESIAQGAPINVKTLHLLKRHICRFLKDYRPGIKERRVIADARQTAERADLTLKGKPTQPISHFQWLANQRDAQWVEEKELIPGQCEDLFDIAAHLYNGRLREAKAAYHQLPENLKEIFHSHLRQLIAIAFEDELETLQALIATANQLVENGEPYPTRQEIDEIFLGLREVISEDTNSSVIVPLKPLQ